MLGELVGHASGQVIGTRVLPADGQEPRVEVTIQGTGQMLGQDIIDLGTYWQTIRPGGVLYGEGHLLIMTGQGDTAEWIGFGVGRPAGKPPAARTAVCGSYRSASGPFARLTTVATVVEFESDEKGAYQWQVWEWLPPAG
jgi:hypothetical protein